MTSEPSRVQLGDPRNRSGYILLEALVSLAILSIVSMVIQGSLRQAIETRGQAQDFTDARFLLEEEINFLELQPRQILGHAEEGVFPAPYERFSYKVKVSKVEVPLPVLTEAQVPNPAVYMQQFVEYMGRISVTIQWTRAGKSFEVIGETLLRPDQVWFVAGGGAA